MSDDNKAFDAELLAWLGENETDPRHDEVELSAHPFVVVSRPFSDLHVHEAHRFANAANAYAFRERAHGVLWFETPLKAFILDDGQDWKV